LLAVSFSALPRLAWARPPTPRTAANHRGQGPDKLEAGPAAIVDFADAAIIGRTPPALDHDLVDSSGLGDGRAVRPRRELVALVAPADRVAPDLAARTWRHTLRVVAREAARTRQERTMVREISPDRAPRHAAPAQMDLSDREVAQRKAFLEFRADDIERLEGIDDLAATYADEVIEAFYAHLLSFPETRAFFQDPQVLAYVKRRQREYFLRLTQGNYDARYVEDRLAIGAAHERIGLPVKSYLGMYNFYLRTVAERLFAALSDDPGRALATFLSLTKLTFLDMGLALDTYIFQRERTIREQQEAIRELSTPVLQVRDRLLILPIIGAIDTQRARQVTQQLLHAIRDARARVVVIDITGVAAVDTTVANHLIQTVDAARLMGATAILTGMSPEIAQTLVKLGVDLTRVSTLGDLQEGLAAAERLLGYTLVAAESDAPAPPDRRSELWPSRS
jgi:rsbT co-antagonist protein RsbR